MQTAFPEERTALRTKVFGGRYSNTSVPSNVLEFLKKKCIVRTECGWILVENAFGHFSLWDDAESVPFNVVDDACMPLSGRAICCLCFLRLDGAGVGLQVRVAAVDLGVVVRVEHGGTFKLEKKKINRNRKTPSIKLWTVGQH